MRASTFINSKISIDNTGVVIDLPVIITVDGILKSYLDYLIVFRNKSESWRSKSVLAVRLLLDYISVNEVAFDRPQRMFSAFSECLFTGTIGQDRYDPSGLYWMPRKQENARFLISLITQYTDWLAIQNEDMGLQLNPYRESTNYEDRLNHAAYWQRKKRAFLSHLWATIPENIGFVRNVNNTNQQSRKSTSIAPAKKFPSGRLDDLLWNGFVKKGFSSESNLVERLNLRDVLITMLMHYGGLRLSEVFHIWVDDISCVYHEGKRLCVVKIYHPSEGKIPGEKLNRRAYLLEKCGMLPRNKYKKTHKLHAGWKGVKFDNDVEKFISIFWFPAEAGEDFYALWLMYVKSQRAPPPKENPHPFAFTSRTGSPYTVGAYNSSLKHAVVRIGLEFSKRAGTTAHGGRHSFGSSLKDAGVPPLYIRNALHHISLESQQVYTQPSEDEIREKLAGAQVKMITDNKKEKYNIIVVKE
jgi:integrase